MTSLMRNAKDFWTGIIYIAVGAVALVIARDYSMGTGTKMGPAYFPTILSFLLILIGVISLIRSFIQPGSPITRVTVKGLLAVVASTVVFGLIIRGAGLAIALPAMVFISSCASESFSWRTTLALALGLTVFCILIFQKGLGVPLPVLGSWFGR